MSRFILITALFATLFVLVGIKAIDYNHRIASLEHACIPTDTGGGVTQCLQPSVLDVKLRACVINTSYVAQTIPQVHTMMDECINTFAR